MENERVTVRFKDIEVYSCLHLFGHHKNCKQYTNSLMTCSKTSYNPNSTLLKDLKQYLSWQGRDHQSQSGCLHSGKGLNQSYGKCRNGAVNHYWNATTNRSLFACTHLTLMNASHKSSLNDSSLNDSHSTGCLLSGGRSWIKPLTGNQTGMTDRKSVV